MRLRGQASTRMYVRGVVRMIDCEAVTHAAFRNKHDGGEPYVEIRVTVSGLGPRHARQFKVQFPPDVAQELSKQLAAHASKYAAQRQEQR